MARQRLSIKKTYKVASMINMPLTRAYVDSEWGHGWVEAWSTPGDSFLVNTKTREYTMLTIGGVPIDSKPLWRKVGCCA
jgi:hypothetical protein